MDTQSCVVPLKEESPGGTKKCQKEDLQKNLNWMPVNLPYHHLQVRFMFVVFKNKFRLLNT